MSRNYKFHNPKGLYFVSFAVVEWADVFLNDQYKDIIVDSLNYCVDNKGMEIISWCIMPTHMHLIYRTDEGIEPQNVLGDFKRFTSKAVVRAIRDNPYELRRKEFLEIFSMAAEESSNVNYHQFWQHDNKPIELWSNKVIRQKVKYVHDNPLEDGLVTSARKYKYSSAVDYAGGKGLVKDVVVADVWSLV